MSCCRECPALSDCRNSCRKCPALSDCRNSCCECPALSDCPNSCCECPALSDCRNSCRECPALSDCRNSCRECPALLRCLGIFFIFEVMFVEMLFNTSCQDVSVAVASFPGTMIELSTIFLRAKRYSMRYVLAAAETIVAIIYSAPRVRIPSSSIKAENRPTGKKTNLCFEKKCK